MKSSSELQILGSKAGFGVEFVHVRCDHPLYCEQGSREVHTIFGQVSGPVATTTRFGGRRLRHRPRRRSIGIVPAGMDGSVEIDGAIESFAVSISAECLALAAAQNARHGGTLVERLSGEDDALYTIIETMAAVCNARRPTDRLAWSSIADALLLRLVGTHLHVEASSPTARILDASTIERLDDYVRSNIASPLDLASLAVIAGCERFRFARAFRAATGLTPHRYVMRLRLQRAREMMRDGRLALADVALAAGFCDQSHMSRWVRRAYGLTPSALSGRRDACKNVQDR